MGQAAQLLCAEQGPWVGVTVPVPWGALSPERVSAGPGLPVVPVLGQSLIQLWLQRGAGELGAAEGEAGGAGPGVGPASTRSCPPGTAHFLPPTRKGEVIIAALDEQRLSTGFSDLLFYFHLSTYLLI